VSIQYSLAGRALFAARRRQIEPHLGGDNITQDTYAFLIERGRAVTFGYSITSSARSSSFLRQEFLKSSGELRK
jgi:hypothetical protein